MFQIGATRQSPSHHQHTCAIHTVITRGKQKRIAPQAKHQNNEPVHCEKNAVPLGVGKQRAARPLTHKKRWWRAGQHRASKAGLHCLNTKQRHQGSERGRRYSGRRRSELRLPAFYVHGSVMGAAVAGSGQCRPIAATSECFRNGAGISNQTASARARVRIKPRCKKDRASSATMVAVGVTRESGSESRSQSHRRTSGRSLKSKPRETKDERQ